VLQPKITKKFTKTPNLGRSRSFKLINVDKTQKLVTSACYDKQHISLYLFATIFTLDEPIMAKLHLFRGYSSDAFIRGELLHRSAKFCHKKRVLGQPIVKIS